MSKWLTGLGRRRMMAVVIDELLALVILTLVAPPLLWALVGAYTFAKQGTFPISLSEVTYWVGAMGTQLWVFSFYLLIGALNEGFWTYKKGGTVGKLLMGLRVVSLSAKSLSVGQVGVRYLGGILCQWTLGLGYLSWRGVHDRIAGTEVQGV